MTLYNKAYIVTAALMTAYMVVSAYVYGHETASTISLRSQCDITAEQRVKLKPSYYKLASFGGRS